MKNYTIKFEETNANVEISAFAPEEKIAEYHVMIHVEPQGEMFSSQYARICKTEEFLMQQPEFQGANIVFKRYFVSDATNQAPLMSSEESFGISIIQQPPLDGSKIAVWLYIVKGGTLKIANGCNVLEHNGYSHIYKMGMIKTEGDSAAQTENLLLEYEEVLSKFNATLEANCVRTWFFVRDVDIQYAGMVKARRENFYTQGLTEKTHYIASTGIGGLPADTRSIVQLGTYALTGAEKSQIKYLYAPEYLNPTYEYGVTFERGTCVEYGDRAEIYISGTASIDNKGNVLYIGDIEKQTLRMLENVNALLLEAKSGFSDVAQIIVYLRDINDYQIVKKIFDERFPDIPKVITLAPVCRPTWLIEMECVAVAERKNQGIMCY
ncbi:MAG: hypothetical protein IIU11_05855 [Bacteroidales bacterium]|jgi:enamine deaminase RidA (YjgF/YER057c/UK114 family)|nr:hypothetical protein [Bacteroidales bacterium]MBR6278797.1 hypothetical protein [Bacteroidales bacterium]